MKALEDVKDCIDKNDITKAKESCMEYDLELRVKVLNINNNIKSESNIQH